MRHELKEVSAFTRPGHPSTGTGTCTHIPLVLLMAQHGHKHVYTLIVCIYALGTVFRVERWVHVRRLDLTRRGQPPGARSPPGTKLSS